jgi:hypothetical protein
VLDNLDRIAGLYAETFFVFAVSDSADDTLAKLQAWLAPPRKGKVLDLGALEADMPVRTARIAHARNACLNEVRGSAARDFDHLIVADLDEILDGPLAIDAVRQAAAWLDGVADRAGAFANAAPRYYDVWALRHDTWCPGDCWHAIWGRPSDQSFEAAKFRESIVRQFELPTELPPIAVRSAFGGLALYKLPFTHGATYRGLDEQDRPVSEHVAFNRAVAEAGGKLHIYPPLIVHAPQQHLYRADEFPLRWRLRMQMHRLTERLRPPWRALLPEQR